MDVIENIWSGKKIIIKQSSYMDSIRVSLAVFR